MSRAAIENAEAEGYPLFIIDISHLPKPTTDDPNRETKPVDYKIIMANLLKGHYPGAVESYNTECSRKAFGMGPSDTWGTRTEIEIDGEQKLLHQCGGDVEESMMCPDEIYMMKNGITPYEMYTDPSHKVNSHVRV